MQEIGIRIRIVSPTLEIDTEDGCTRTSAGLKAATTPVNPTEVVWVPVESIRARTPWTICCPNPFCAVLVVVHEPPSPAEKVPAKFAPPTMSSPPRVGVTPPEVIAVLVPVRLLVALAVIVPPLAS